MTDGWYGIDLDGTLAIYPHSFPEIGPPIPVMVGFVQELLKEGKDVRIFTARVGIRPELSSEHGIADVHFAADQEAKIQAWCVAQFGIELPVTAQKDFKMVALYDDRCVQMIPNTGQSVSSMYEEKLTKLAEGVVAALNADLG